MRRPERSEEFDSLLWERWIHGGLDVEAELRYAEVQKGRASVADWTLKEREGIRKSKRDEQARWI